MDKPIAISDDVFWIGVNDLETDLFEAIWPLPQGVCYNSYIINDERIAVVDTVKRSFIPNYLEKIHTLIGQQRTVDYLIVNHMEPDHSGALKILYEVFPEIKIVGNEKTALFIKGFYGIPDKNIMIVKDGDALELGKHRIRFYLTPMVHWPETMMSYDEFCGILFSGDAFGGFGSLNGGIFDDEVDLNYFESEILRYFSNIVGKYSPMVQKAMEKLKGLDIKVIASTHGPIFRSNPRYIISLYDKWSRYETEKGVVIVYASMYGNTQIMMESIARSLAEQGVERIRIHNISRSHISFVLTDIWRFKGLVLGSCTYNTKLFPPMEQLISILENDRLKNRIMGIFGSYCWSGGAVKALRDFAERFKNTLVEPVVETKYSPSVEDLEACIELGRNLAEKL